MRRTGHAPHRWRRLWTVLLLTALGVVAVVWWCDRVVRTHTAAYVHDRLADVPAHDVALVLGTSHRVRGGGPNPWFINRMRAAADLYHTGRVRHLLVSGDNAVANYNEPQRMRDALIALGVDSGRIVMDHAGFRTFDSVVRAREVFGQERFIVVSQRFHTERAVYIAQRLGITAVGYNAADKEGSTLRMRLREKGARVKVFIDLLLGVRPRFLGDPVPIHTHTGVDTLRSDTAAQP